MSLINESINNAFLSHKKGTKGTKRKRTTWTIKSRLCQRRFGGANDVVGKLMNSFLCAFCAFLWPLFISQRGERIDLRRAAGREIAGDQRHCNQARRNDH